MIHISLYRFAFVCIADSNSIERKRSAYTILLNLYDPIRRECIYTEYSACLAGWWCPNPIYVYITSAIKKTKAIWHQLKTFLCPEISAENGNNTTLNGIVCTPFSTKGERERKKKNCINKLLECVFEFFFGHFKANKLILCAFHKLSKPINCEVIKTKGIFIINKKASARAHNCFK